MDRIGNLDRNILTGIVSPEIGHGDNCLRVPKGSTFSWWSLGLSEVVVFEDQVTKCLSTIKPLSRSARLGSDLPSRAPRLPHTPPPSTLEVLPVIVVGMIGIAMETSKPGGVRRKVETNSPA